MFQYSETDLTLIFSALQYASDKHRGQYRKDGVTAYIHHPIEVSELLWRVGGIKEAPVIAATLLHDTIEDTDATEGSLQDRFGIVVAGMVVEVTDDKHVTYQERKRLQIIRAPQLSHEAKLIRLADKICNVKDMTDRPPHDWNSKRRLEYFDWTEKVIAGVRGSHAELEKLYDKVLQNGRNHLSD